MKRTSLPNSTLRQLREVIAEALLVHTLCGFMTTFGEFWSNFITLEFVHGRAIYEMKWGGRFLHMGGPSRAGENNKSFVCLLQEYLRLNMDYRQRALILLATGFGVDRGRVDGLIQHYLKLKSGVSNLPFLFG